MCLMDVWWIFDGKYCEVYDMYIMVMIYIILYRAIYLFIDSYMDINSYWLIGIDYYYLGYI